MDKMAVANPWSDETPHQTHRGHLQYIAAVSADGHGAITAKSSDAHHHTMQ